MLKKTLTFLGMLLLIIAKDGFKIHREECSVCKSQGI